MPQFNFHPYLSIFPSLRHKQTHTRWRRRRVDGTLIKGTYSALHPSLSLHAHPPFVCLQTDRLHFQMFRSAIPLLMWQQIDGIPGTAVSALYGSVSPFPLYPSPTICQSLSFAYVYSFTSTSLIPSLNGWLLPFSADAVAPQPPKAIAIVPFLTPTHTLNYIVS